MVNNTSLVSSTFLALGWAKHKPPTTDLTRFLPIAAELFLLTTLLFFFHLRLPAQASNKPKKPPLPPGPTPWPIISSLPTMYRKKPYFRWIVGVAKGKDLTCIRLGNTRVIVVNCPRLACEFLKNHDMSFTSRPLTMATEYSSRGFLSVVVAPWGDQWKKMRRVVASEVLNPKRLQWQANLRLEEADNLVRYIYNQCKDSILGTGAVVNIRLAVRYYCGNIIRMMLFNRRYFGEGAENCGLGIEDVEHVEAAFTVLSLIYAFCMSDYMPCLRCLDLDGHEKIMKKAVGVIDKYHDPIIDERIKKWRGEKECLKGEKEDLLNVLISLKDNNGKPLLTTEEIKAQSAELVYATVDNPSNVVEWAIAEMLNQPHILQKAVEEIDREVGKERLVQESDFSQLVYVKACAREALRLHPVAPFNLPHVSCADTTVTGFFIPKGSHVLLSRVGLGRNPKVWDEPLKFDPDRHLKDGSINVELAEPDLRFIAFSMGRRGCMGAALGTMMTYMLLARLLQAFAWSMPRGEQRIDLSEDEKSLFMAKPLHALAMPRLGMLENVQRSGFC